MSKNRTPTQNPPPSRERPNTKRDDMSSGDMAPPAPGSSKGGGALNPQQGSRIRDKKYDR